WTTPSTQLIGSAYSAGPFFSWRRLVHLQYDSDMDDRESRSSRSLIMEAARLGDVAWSRALARDGTFGQAFTVSRQQCLARLFLEGSSAQPLQCQLPLKRLDARGSARSTASVIGGLLQRNLPGAELSRRCGSASELCAVPGVRRRNLVTLAKGAVEVRNIAEPDVVCDRADA